MSIDDEGVVDFICDGENETCLVIVDPYSWDGEADDKKHLLLIQNKLNMYLSFIESGELLERRPSAHGKDVVISVMAQYDPAKVGKVFYCQAKRIIENAGFKFELSVHSPET